MATADERCANLTGFLHQKPSLPLMNTDNNKPVVTTDEQQKIGRNINQKASLAEHAEDAE